MKQLILLIIVILFIILASTFLIYSMLSSKESFATGDYSIEKIYIANSTHGKGRGVFANQSIKAGEIVEIAPIILEKTHKIIKDSNVMQYVFYSDASETEYAIAFGYGSMYNHSDTNNAEWKVDKPNLRLIVTAIKDIPKGAEIYVSYGSRYWSSRGVEPN